VEFQMSKTSLSQRVAVTGLGLVTPLGIGIGKNWQKLCAGESGIGLITRFDASGFRSRIAGEIKEFEPVDFIDKKTARRTSRFIHLALAAGRMALEDSRLVIGPTDAPQTGVSVATAFGGSESFDKNHLLFVQGNQDRISPFFITSYICNMASAELAIQSGAQGPLLCSVTACAAGTHSVGEAFKVIQRGDAAVMLAGGSDTGLNATIFAGFDSIRAMSSRNDEPAKASRPFDKDRDGFVCSEGSGMVVLEELEHALSRGARIYAEVLGYGNTCDAHHITAPDPEAMGASRCIEMALKDAGITPAEIDHINAHGTSTQLNDLAETRAIKRVFGERAKNIPITANKSMLGHLWGAAGAVEAIFSVLTIDRGVIPPTINYENPDPECDLDYTPNTARKAEVKTVLSNSFGFGGTNGCLVFRRYSS
jgi:3-oxoacyl-[acyl-carrier-protein] synthase II